MTMELARKRNRWGVALVLAALVLAGVATGGRLAAAAPAAADNCTLAAHFLPATFGGYLADVVVAAAGDVWAVGGSGGSWNEYQGQFIGRPVIQHWAGTEWLPVDAPALPAPATEGALGGLTAFGANDVWAVGFASPPNPSGAPLPTHPLTLHWDG